MADSSVDKDVEMALLTGSMLIFKSWGVKSLCLLINSLTSLLWLPTGLNTFFIFNPQNPIARSRTWSYCLWGQRENVALATWGLVFSQKQKWGELLHFEPFSWHKCRDFGTSLSFLPHHSTYVGLCNSFFQRRGNQRCKVGGQGGFILLKHICQSWKR